MRKFPLYLAPMEDVTDVDFRLLCKRFGADRVYTEFVNADALIRDVESTVRKLHFDPAERPVAIQIYGSHVESIVSAAKIVEAVQPDFIDLNFGCPVKKIASKGAGAGLLQDLDKLLDIASSVVKSVQLPVTVKTRLGWDEKDLHTSRLRAVGNDTPLIIDLVHALQDCGIAEVTIHGRTRSQMYTGAADWTLIGRVKNDPLVHIPIIGNGDITNAQTAYHHFSQYGVDAVMIGRATFGCPWIFQDIKAFLNHSIDNFGDPVPSEHSMRWCVDVLKEYVQAVIERIGDERKGIIHTRRHFANAPFLKGLPSFRNMRIALLQATRRQDVFDILDQIAERYGDNAQ